MNYLNCIFTTKHENFHRKKFKFLFHVVLECKQNLGVGLHFNLESFGVIIVNYKIRKFNFSTLFQMLNDCKSYENTILIQINFDLCNQ